MKRKKISCPAVKRRQAKRRGKASIEFYDNDGDPQYYCMGWIDMATDELLETCRNCPDHVENAQKDLEEIQNDRRKEADR